LLEGFLSSFQNIDKVTAVIAAKIGSADITDLNAYYYAKSFVAENFPKGALSSERLGHLAVLCRSLTISIPIAALVFGIQLKLNADWKRLYLAHIAWIAPLTFVFYLAFELYWKESVWLVLRALLAWNSLQT
jgi:hypothetical protein